ncbi:MAG: hypothetical protein J6R32_09395 [Bacteroidales bacterium]|nr:hypothetical protein [Bacteroidales bacterium]
MTDITNYRTDELTALFMCLFDEQSSPIMDPDDCTKLSVQPIYKLAVGLDTESTTITHQETYGKKKQKSVTIVDHCFCYTYQIAVGTEHYAIYRLPEQLFTFLDTLIDTLHYLNMGADYPAKCIIWVANLSHEFSFIKYKLFQMLECKKCFAKSPRECLYLNFDVVEIRECLGLFGKSLSDIADKWCTTKKLKGDLDYSKIRISNSEYCTPLTAEETQYCINDVIILTEMHESIFETYKQDNGGLVLPYTRSGFVRTKLKNSIREDPALTKQRLNYNESKLDPKMHKKNNIEFLKMCNKHKYVDAAQWNLCREYGYSGGLCGSNIDKVGKTLKNVMMADLTSDYPAIMLHKKFPAGWLHETDLSEYTTIRDEHKKPFFILAIVDFKSFSHHATFSKHKVLNYESKIFAAKWGKPLEMIAYNGKILQAKNCYVVLNDVDIEAYEMIYELKITPLRMWVFDRYKRLPDWLQNPIKEDYITKATLKHTPAEETQAYKDAKININTYYGVTATKTHDCLNVFDEVYDPVAKTGGTFEPDRRKSFAQMRCESWLDPYIAFWTTSYARKILMYFISKYPDRIIQYDTDSLFYEPCPELDEELRKYNAGVEKINRKIFKDHPQKELLLDLGCWDFDKMYDQFLAMGAKKYIKQQGDKIMPVIAGLPKGAIPAEIKAKNIKKPLEYYNVTKWVKKNYMKPELIIKHMFSHKFASVYDDRDTTYKITLTDCCGVTGDQICGCYHAIIPIDFTLSMAKDYIQQVFNVQNRKF